ncbi:MAG: small multi-drug export protein [Spirochaetia bacterium]|jgi:uncharacterized membrane protein|nr:small multi-drug export protein [Spirochaetales bacterium]MDX9783933.1 small multi-drug export protein [Spirochaetia bacterium]
MDSSIIYSGLLALLPISELRGAIPYAVLNGIDLLPAALLATGINALVPFLAYLFLSTIHKLLYRLGFYKSFFDRFVEKARAKVHGKVERYGYWGLLIFVAIPLPVTGAWTGTLGAWVLGMDKKKAILAILGGVLVAGFFVSVLVALLGAGAKIIFLKSF